MDSPCPIFVSGFFRVPEVVGQITCRTNSIKSLITIVENHHITKYIVLNFFYSLPDSVNMKAKPVPISRSAHQASSNSRNILSTDPISNFRMASNFLSGSAGSNRVLARALSTPKEQVRTTKSASISGPSETWTRIVFSPSRTIFVTSELRRIELAGISLARIESRSICLCSDLYAIRDFPGHFL